MKRKRQSHLFEIVLVLLIFAVISMSNGLSEADLDREIATNIAKAEGKKEIITLLDEAAERWFEK